MLGHRRADASPFVAHEHAAVFGTGPAALDALAVEVFDAAARHTDDVLMFVADDPDPARLAALPGRDALLASGRLRLVRTADAYPHHDPVRLLAQFDDVLRGVRAEGHGGLRVVADNTPHARGGDGAFAQWLAWEQTTDRWQHTNPVVGVCWFDRAALDPARVDQLASLHPAGSGDVEPPPFRLLATGPGVRLVGDVGSHHVTRLLRLLGLTPHDGDLVLDVTDVGYLHHTVFAALEFASPSAHRIRVVGASDGLRRVWEAVGDPDGRVELV